MNEADGLVASVLEQPDEETRWLVLADWLEEKGDPINSARAALLRLQAERLADPDQVEQVDEQSATILLDHPDLVGPWQPLVERSSMVEAYPIQSAPLALVLFLLADLTSVVDGPLVAGSTWEGELLQGRYAFPTTLWVRRRKGNRFEGDMKEDFTSMYRAQVTGRFYFRGAIFGKTHVAFATYRVTGAGSGPGLYQFQLNRLRRMNGDWQVGNTEWRGKMWLKLKLTEQ